MPFDSFIKSRSVRCYALCIALSAVASPVRAADVQPPLGVLGLTANANVEVTRDLLQIAFSTTRDGSDANAVQGQLKQALDAALTEAKKAAKPGQVDVQTGNFSLYPRYATVQSTGKQTLNGWQGSAELIVEGRDLATIGALVGKITTMTVARVGYRLSREAMQRVEADVVADAIARFRGKAGDYAKQFGFTGYAIREVTVSSSDAGQGGMRAMPMSAMARSSSAPSEPLAVEPGKETVTATVNGTVQMK